jgi:hypothetical protein
LYDAQLDYDIIPGDCLRDMDKDGVISGEQYPVLLVPYSTYLSKQQADLLARHADRVVIVGDRGYDGYPHVSLGELVAYMEPYRDVRVIGGGKGVRYYHYEKDGNACYLFSNEDITKTLHTTVTLGGFTGGAYTLYDPFEKGMEPFPLFSGNHAGKYGNDVPFPHGEKRTAHIPAGK